VCFVKHQIHFFLTTLSATAKPTARKRSASTALSGKDRPPKHESNLKLEALTQLLSDVATISDAATIAKASQIDVGPRKKSLPPNNAAPTRLWKDCKLPLYVRDTKTDGYEEVLTDFQFPYRNQVSLSTWSRNFFKFTFIGHAWGFRNATILL